MEDVSNSACDCGEVADVYYCDDYQYVAICWECYNNTPTTIYEPTDD
jgi:hypothetical protein